MSAKLPVERPAASGPPFPVYHIYGIPVRSQWPLSNSERADSRAPLVELAEGSDESFEDARLEAERHPPPDTEFFQHIPLPDGSDYLRWHELFEFIVSADGRRIRGRAYRNFSFEAFQTYMLGAVLSFSLLKLGLEPLHATAVVVDGKAVGFLGNNGYGKSSMAGTFVQAGFPLLTDDVLVATESERGFFAHPGPARIKLFPEVAKTLLGAESSGVPMNPLTKKQIIPLESAAAFTEGVPLQALYVLPTPPAQSPEPGSAQRPEPPGEQPVTIRLLPPQEAFIQLVASAFNDAVLGQARLEQHFRLITQLASRIPVKQLSYARVFDALPGVRQRILDDLRGHDSGHHRGQHRP